MRLNSIKLSGFKSFADTVTLALPGQLVGVVGPNGCGKSNIMDAVRWVLGESRASELRGQSMQDVIFNGTSERKPASRTLVELSFDNSDQRAGGAFGRFSEIAVRRLLTRDGQSTYYINGQKVRRRDVHDVFLGTGLGPRAYAIIGQGTIGRIIESRPEELRLFLEEAAGVSKYKERRRQTQNRLRDTRENLTRLDDILRELASALAKLERQASVAARYRKLQQQLAQARQQLWQQRRRQAQRECRQLQQQLRAAELQLQQLVTGLREQETAVEHLRQRHTEAGDAASSAQARLYEATAEVGQLEAQIRFVAEGRKRVQAQLAQLQEQQLHWQTQQEEAQQEQQALAQQEAVLQQRLQAEDAHIADVARQLARERVQLQQAQAATRVARERVSGLAQRRQLLAASQHNVQEQLQQVQARRQRLRAAQAQLPEADAAALQALQARSEAAEQAAARAAQTLAEHEQAMKALEQARAEAQALASQENVALAEARARLRALQDLQQKVQARSALQPWRKKHGLDAAAPLWQQLRVAPGWERALEAALRERLAALPVSSMDAVIDMAQDAPPARLTLYVPAQDEIPVQRGAGEPRLPALLEHVQLHDANLHALLTDWLAGCLAAPTLADALQQRRQLQPGQMIFTPQGHCVHAGGISFHADDSEQAGLLARATEIQTMRKQVRAQELLSEQAATSLAGAQAAAEQGSQTVAAARREAAHQRDAAHALQMQQLRASQEQQQLAERRARLAGDLAELDGTQVELQRRQAAAEEDAIGLQAEERAARAHREECEQQETAARQRMGATRDEHARLQRARQESGFEQRSLQARHAELERALATASDQSAQVQTRLQRAEAELAELGDGPAQASLQQALAGKLACEQALAGARSRHEDAAAQLRAADEQRLALQHQQEPLNARMTELRLQEQAAALRAQEAAQRLAEVGVDSAAPEDEETAALQDPEGADAPLLDEAQLQADMERMQRKIQNLGAVNLAALDELETQRQRKTMLDSQHADLTEAMQTLEGAIRKIDAETRALLRQTFDAVNDHFGRMFPELFGGGRARLVMTGEEILDAGVEVMAQPPGKKNQTIHLLSGGEKALTAIALVFAIFQLNPAPFCLLDEVDAPLDDANTGRFARLVQKMSAQGTQFLFISHNRIAMEMAEQLIGVTMQEQGVSRVVAVDMQDAVRLSEAA